MRRVVLCALGVATALATASAYNDDTDDDVAIPAWRVVRPASPSPAFNEASIFCEVHPVGTHGAEVHFRNLSSETLHFDWWLPGRQAPDANIRLTLPPFFETKEETRTSVSLRHGRPGLAAATATIFEVRRGAVDVGPALCPHVAAPDPAPPDEEWMPVRATRDEALVRRSGLMARLVRDAGATRVVFRNPTYRDLHFAFRVPALGGDDAPRMHVAAGAESSAVVPAERGVAPHPLLRVVVRDLRVGDDSGALYAQEKPDEGAWFPLSTADGSAKLPHEKLLAAIEPLPDGRARVRFRSKLRTAARLRFAVTGYQSAGRENDVVSVPPGGDAETVVVLDAPADARIAVARLRVFEVSHRDEQ